MLSVDAPRVAPGQVVVDGFFQDWTGPNLKGLKVGTSKTGHFELRAARDGKMLFLVIGVVDDRFVPTPPESHSAGDRIRLRLGEAPELVIDPGDLEDRRPVAAWLASGGHAKLGPIQVDGAVRPYGWIVEVGIPEAVVWQRGWRPEGVSLSVALLDDDGAGSLETLGGEIMLDFPEGLANRALLLREAGLPEKGLLAQERLIDVGGDSRPERVVVASGVLGLYGEGLGEGAYYLMSLPFGEAARVTGLGSRDLDGDGARELLVEFDVRRQLGSAVQIQGFLEVLQWTESGLVSLLGLELRNEDGAGRTVRNELSFVKAPKSGGWVSIAVSILPAEGVTEGSYVDPDAGYTLAYHPLLLPWGWRSRVVYSYESGRYVKGP